MSFHSLNYLLFLIPVLAAFYLTKGRLRRLILLCASLYFYNCWGWQYPVLLAAEILLSYFAAVLTERMHGRRRTGALAAGLILNLGILFVFKYLDFFVSSVASVCRLQVRSPDLVLTVGISFWSFQACSYLIDVYQGKIPAEKDILDYALYLAFFPKLSQGPIERAADLLPQLKTARPFDYDRFAKGLTRFIWGMMKKVVLADNLAVAVNTVFAVPAEHTGIQIVFALFCYTFQIYMDFSGYSDMAIGSAALFGIDLHENFNAPYFATGIQDFWRRWHITLTSWFRDYLYFPLGGSRTTVFRHLLNVLIVFAVSGLWHGAAWNYVVWGLLHGMLQVIGIVLRKHRKKPEARDPRMGKLRKGLQITFTFLTVNYTWLFFRANSVSDAVFMTKRMMLIPFKGGFPLNCASLGLSTDMLTVLAILLILVFLVEALKLRTDFVDRFNRTVWPRYAAYAVIVIATLVFGYYGKGFDPQDFVYFRF